MIMDTFILDDPNELVNQKKLMESTKILLINILKQYFNKNVVEPIKKPCLEQKDILATNQKYYQIHCLKHLKLSLHLQGGVTECMKQRNEFEKEKFFEKLN